MYHAKVGFYTIMKFLRLVGILHSDQFQSPLEGLNFCRHGCISLSFSTILLVVNKGLFMSISLFV